MSKRQRLDFDANGNIIENDACIGEYAATSDTGSSAGFTVKSERQNDVMFPSVLNGDQARQMPAVGFRVSIGYTLDPLPFSDHVKL